MFIFGFFLVLCRKWTMRVVLYSWRNPNLPHGRFLRSWYWASAHASILCMKNGIFELQRKNVKTYHTQNPSFYVIVLQIHQSSKSTSAMTSSSVPSPLPLRFFIHRATQRRNFISLSRIFRCDLRGDLCTFTSLSTSCNDISGILRWGSSVLCYKWVLSWWLLFCTLSIAR